METNLNCDLGEKSIHHSGENDEQLMQIINTANIACGFHAGDENTMLKSIKLSKKYRVNIGAHPGFPDKKNFGRERIYLEKNEVKKLILDQILTWDEDYYWYVCSEDELDDSCLDIMHFSINPLPSYHTENIEVQYLDEDNYSEGINIIDLFIMSNLSTSKSEVRRIIKNNGIRLNNKIVENEKIIVSINDFSNNNLVKLSLGKKNHAVIKLV